MNFYRQGPYRPGGSGIRLGVPGLTPMVRGIILFTSGVWVVQFLLSLSGIRLAAIFGVVPALVIRGMIWQPFTYMFLHSDRELFHLIFNMLMLWMFGGDLERYWGSRAFLRFYLVCGVGAGIGATLFGLVVPGLSRVAVIGASGAIYGLFMAFGVIFSERIILFMLIFPMKARTMALIMFLVTFFYTLTQPSSGVSHISHLGGAIVGYLYLKRAWRFGEFWRELRWRIRRRRFRVMPPRDDTDRWVN